MNDEQSNMIHELIGEVQSLSYLVDEPAAALTIQADGQRIAVRAYGRLALDLRALPRGVTICATLYDSSPYEPKLVALTLPPA